MREQKFRLRLARQRWSAGLVLPLVVALVAMLVGPLTPASADDPNNYVTIEHTPPPTGIAGDNLPVTATFRYTCPFLSECRRATQRLVYFVADGTTRSIEHTIENPAAVEVWNVLIPAEAVRYPDVRYHFEVDFFAYWIGQEHWDPFSDRAPATGEYTVSVKNQVRFSVTNPDGTPAANVPIRWFVEGDVAPLSSLSTDVNGRVSWDVPMNLPAIASTSTTTGVAFIQMLVFTNFPTAALLADGPRSGNALHMRLQVNSGNRLLPAVQVSVQDKTFALSPDSIPFNRNLSSRSSEVTRIGEKRGIKDYIARNIGGALHMKSELTYTSSASSESTWLINTGNGWTGSEASTTAKSGQSFTTGTSWLGDAAGGCNWNDPQVDGYCMNHGLLIGWTYGLYDVWGCVPAGFFPYCYSYEQYLLDYPDTALSVSEEFEPQTVPSKHGKASILQPNCYFRMGVPEFYSTNTRGETYSSQIGFLGESLPKPVKLTVTFRRSATQGTSTGYAWGMKMEEDKTMGGDWYHFLWVENGRASNPPKCPVDNPQKTWTQASTADLSLTQ